MSEEEIERVNAILETDLAYPEETKSEVIELRFIILIYLLF